MKKKQFVFIVLIFVMFLIFRPIIINSEKNYAKRIEFKGTVTNIIWESRNHGLPIFFIDVADGKPLELSHFSIALTDGSINVGDEIKKMAGDDYCLINGQKVNFSNF